MLYNEEVKNNFLKDYLRSRVVSETSVKRSSIYGDQTIYTKINLIDDKNKVGIHIGRQDIYLEMGEIVEVKILEKSALIVGDIMQIKINVE